MERIYQTPMIELFDLKTEGAFCVSDDSQLEGVGENMGSWGN